MTPARGSSTPSPRLLMAGLTFTCLVTAIVSSLGAPLVPSIAADEHVSVSSAQWSVTISLLVAAVVSPMVGRLGDGPHRRAVVLTSLAAVVLGCVLAALPAGFPVLLIGRALQGIGLSLTSVAIAAARDALPPQRARAGAALLSTTAVIGVGLGYPLTAVVARAGGLHAAYWFGAGVSVAALLAAAMVVPSTAGRQVMRIDPLGAVVFALGLSVLMVGISEGQRWQWASARTLSALAGGLALLLGWTVRELRTANPLVSLRFLRTPSAIVASLAALVSGVGMYLLFSLVIRFIQTPESTGYGLGESVVVAGLVLVPQSVAAYLVTRVTPWAVRRTSAELVLPLAAFVMTLAMILFATARSGLWLIFAVMILTGIGVGAIFAVMPALIIHAVPADQTGGAFGLNQVLRFVGFAAGSALSAVLLDAYTPEGSAFPTDHGYTVAGISGCAIWAFVGLCCIPFAARTQPRPTAGLPARRQAEPTP